MKRNLFAILSVVAALGLSAFSVQKNADDVELRQTVLYLIYNSGSQAAIGSYTAQTTIPFCPGAVRLCAVRIEDHNGDNVITQAEFTVVFTALDTNSNGTLDDQTETTTLLKKA